MPSSEDQTEQGQYRQHLKSNRVTLTSAALPPKTAFDGSLGGYEWLLFFLLPVLTLVFDSNPIFSNGSSVDAWVYLGFFYNLVDFLRDAFPGTYYGSRLSWLIPGYIVHHVFSPVVATCVLHLLVYFIATFSLYYTLLRTAGKSAALLISVAFGIYPYFWQAAGSDYVDGFGIAMYLGTTALLTKAASSSHRWPLAAAGAVYALLIYSNLVWVAFTPMLALHYIGLCRIFNHGIRAATVFRGLMWAALGAAGVTLALGTTNYFIDGNFWFYEPSVKFAASEAGKPNRWYRGVWAGGVLLPWLILPAVVFVFGLLLQVRGRIRSGRSGIATLYFLEFLAAAALFVWLQYRGSPLLGLMYYASYLIPMTFLAAPVFLPDTFETRGRASWIGALALACGLTVAWRCGVTLATHRPGVLDCATAIAFIGVLAAGARTSWRFAALAAGLAVIYARSSVGDLGIDESPPGIHRASYARIMTTRSTIEAARRDSKIRFWYTESDPNWVEFRGLSSTYLWEYSLINLGFPKLPPDPRISAPAFVVVASSMPDAPQVAIAALVPALREKAMMPMLRRVESLNGAFGPYTVSIIEAVDDYSRYQALSWKEGQLEVPEPGTPGTAASLPDSAWQIVESDKGATLNRTADGIRVKTSATRYGYGTVYPELKAPRDGVYRFVLRYSPVSGALMFGALASSGQWITTTTVRSPDGNDRIMRLETPLRKGEAFQLITVNYQKRKQTAEYVIKRAEAFVRRTGER